VHIFNTNIGKEINLLYAHEEAVVKVFYSDFDVIFEKINSNLRTNSLQQARIQLTKYGIFKMSIKFLSRYIMIQNQKLYQPTIELRTVYLCVWILKGF